MLKESALPFREQRNLGLCDQGGRTEDAEGEDDGEVRLQEVGRENGSRGDRSRRVRGAGPLHRRGGRPRWSTADRPPQDYEEERLLRHKEASRPGHRLTGEPPRPR